MSNYTDLLSNATQAEPLFGENMVKNNAGGFVFAIDD